MIYYKKKVIFRQEHQAQYLRVSTIIMIGDGLEEIKSLTSMIGKTIIKLVWIFPELDFFGKLKPVRTCLLTGLHMKNRFSPENVLLRKTFLKMIFRVFLKYIFCFYFNSLLSLFYYYYCCSNFYHCLVTIIILRSVIYFLVNWFFDLFLIVLTEWF